MIVVDTGPLVAAAISSDINHRRCVDLFASLRLASSGLERAADLIGQYADLPLGFVDASVVALAEQLELQEIATLDRRHFSVVRPRHVDAFTLLP